MPVVGASQMASDLLVVDAVTLRFGAQGELSHASSLKTSHTFLDLDVTGLTPPFTYGSVADRQAPFQVTVVGVGLKARQRGVDSDAARSYRFRG